MRAALWGSLVALVIDVLMLSQGKPSLWQQMGTLGGMFDAQGRALLAGHLSVPPASAGIEGYLVGGHTYIYFGLAPVLLRLPVLLVTHALDGRMTQLSMLLALLVLLWAGARLQWRVRTFMRAGDPVAPGERACAFSLALALGAGAVPLFLVSWPVVYHEAELWGAALSLLAVDAVLGVAQDPSPRRIGWAGATCLLAVNSRVSVGIGPVLALAFVGAWLVAARKVSRVPRTVAQISLAVVIPLVTELAVNTARFGSLFGPPLSKQVFSKFDPGVKAFIASNHGSWFGLKFLPTTLLAAVRPDAIGLTRGFPWIGLPDSPPTVFGHVRFESLLPALSAFTSMALFCVLLLVGLPALIRRRGLLPVAGIVAATGAAYLVALAWAATATRFLADLIPFLFLGACVGSQIWLEAERMRGRISGRMVVAGIAALTLAGIVINGSVGLVQQRLLAATTSPATRAAFVRSQNDVDRFLGRRARGVFAGSRLPSRALGPLGDLFVLGRCDGLYVESFGGAWLPVEQTTRSGLYELDVRFSPRSVDAGPQALMALGSGGNRVTVVVVPVGASSMRFSVLLGGRPAGTSAPVLVAGGRRTRVTVSYGHFEQGLLLTLQVGGTGSVLTLPAPYDRLAVETLGRAPGDPRIAPFLGSVVQEREAAPVCHQLARRAGLR